MDVKHLQNIQLVLDEGVARKKTVGANCLVMHDGKEIAYFESGMANVEQNVAFARDIICRFYSMTKPITSIAAMMLIEKGKIDFTDEVADFLPEFKNLYICDNACNNAQNAQSSANGSSAPNVDKNANLRQSHDTSSKNVRKATRALLVQDLLNMTSGYTYGGCATLGEVQTSALINDLNASAIGANNITTRDFARRIAQIPLNFEPGTDYQYGLSADIMGALIEEVTQMKFSAFLKQNIFEPLEMADTDFFVPAQKQKRLSGVYSRYDLSRFNSCNLGIQDDMQKAPAFESGGAGLVGTIDDYAHFCAMLANGGVYKNARLLKERTVAYLESAELRAPLQKCFDKKMEHLAGYSYANFMRVCKNASKASSIASNGEFGWDGWLGTVMAVDRKNALCFVYMQQMTDTGLNYVSRRCKNVIYASL